MNARPIGIIDSGSGGLSIQQEITKLLLRESTIYIGDHANLPYSEKSTDFIKRRICTLIRFLLEHEAKMIVIACNTATVAGIDWYRKQFPNLPIVGVVPVIKTAAQMTKTHTFCVLSTVYTARSLYQRQLISRFAPHDTVLSLGNTALVKLIESPRPSNVNIRKEVKKLLQKVGTHPIDVVVLGCSHFPFIRSSIKKIIGSRIPLIDSGAAVARHVERILIHNKIASHNRTVFHEYFTTGNPESVSRIFSRLLKSRTVVLRSPIA